MRAGGSLFIIHYYNLYTILPTNTWDKALFLPSYLPSAILVAMLSLKNDRKVAIGGSILAICHGNKVLLALQQ